MKKIYIFFFFLFCSCGAPYCKKYPFEEMDDYKSWMVYSEGDKIYFHSDSIIDTMIVVEKRETIPMNTNPFWLENGLWFRDEHEFHAGVCYSYVLHHQGYELHGSMLISKRAMGEYARFSFSITGIFGNKVPVNELGQDTVNGVVFNDCIKIIGDTVDFPNRFVCPVEASSACWSKSRGLLYYEIDGKKYYQVTH